MAAPETRLNLYLANYYAASQLGKGDRTAVEVAFKQLIDADEDFRKDAKAKLKGLTLAIRQRDHISNIHHDILTRVLPNG